MNRLLIEVAAVLLLIGGFAIYFRHAGAAQCVNGVEVATAHEEGHQEAQAADDHRTIEIEAAAYAKANTSDLDAIPAPVVRVCKYPGSSSVPSATPAGSSPDAPAPLRGADPLPVVAGPDIGSSLVRNDHVADAQVAGLEDYITRVCRVR